MIFAIDFDGTIVENEFPAIGDLHTAADTFIRFLKADGHKFTLWTCRCGKQLEEAVAFLKAHNLAPDYVNQSPPEMIEEYQNDTRKVYADVYIDDRNAGGLVWPFHLLRCGEE